MEKINLRVKKRIDIRKKVVELLKGKTHAGEHVFSNSAVPPWHEELPVILVYPRSEDISEYAIAPRELKRELQLAIEIVAAGPEEKPGAEVPEGQLSLEDILDQIAEQVEFEMSKDETLGRLADDSILTGVEFDFDSSGGESIGSCRMTYKTTYYRPSPDLEPDYPVLKKVGAKYKVGHDNAAPDNVVEGEDSVDIP